jgi:hypothetical protein
MIENFKIYLIEVGMKKLLPMAVMGALTALCGLIAAHQGLLSNMGIDYDATQRTIDISLDTLGNWAIVGLGALITALMTAAKHTTVAVVTGDPLSGDMRQNQTPAQAITGGARANDPK